MENDKPSRMPNVPPFVKFVCANVPMVFDDSLSYYEALCALWKYVQGMTDVINNNATLEEEFIEKFNVLSGKFDELKTYVDTYFDNLDVQEEINNKLDEMVEDGVLQEIIETYVSSVMNLTPLYYTYLYNSATGFGNSLVVHGDKNIIVDLGDRAGVVLNYLVDNNITKLDAIVLTHYHADHIGGSDASALSEIINSDDVDTSECKVYLPHKGIDWSQVTGDTTALEASEVAVKNILLTAGIGYIEPDNEQIVALDDIYLQFFNIGSSFYSQYYGKNVFGASDSSTDYNAFSMPVKITYNNVSCFESSDLTYPAQQLNAKYLTGIELYHSVHHGVYTPIANEWADKLNPQYCVVTPNDGSLNIRNQDIYLCGMKKATIYNVKKIENNLTIKQEYNALSCNSIKTATSPYVGISANPITRIVSGDDLDDFITPGTYYSALGGESLTISNLPPATNEDSTVSGHSFRLDVLATGFAGEDKQIRQVLYWNNAGTYSYVGEWFRLKNSTGSWSSWMYIEHQRTEGLQTITNAMVSGYLSGDGKKVFFNLPQIYNIPASLKITNPTITNANFKGITGGFIFIASAGTTTHSLEIYEDSGSKYGVITKTDGTAFSATPDTPIGGMLSFKFTLTRN